MRGIPFGGGAKGKPKKQPGFCGSPSERETHMVCEKSRIVSEFVRLLGWGGGGDGVIIVVITHRHEQPEMFNWAIASHSLGCNSEARQRTFAR